MSTSRTERAHKAPVRMVGASLALAVSLSGAATVALPLLAGLVAEIVGVRPLFAGSLVLSAAALLWCLFCVKEPRTLPGNGSAEADAAAP